MLYHTLLVRSLRYDRRSWCRAMSTVGALLAFLLVASAAAAGVLPLAFSLSRGTH